MKEPAPTSTGRTPPTWVLLLIFMLVNLATLAVLRRELSGGLPRTRLDRAGPHPG